MDSSAQVAELLPFHPSPADYEHAARLLCRFGHVPGIPLNPNAFRVLCYLAGQGPGVVQRHRCIGDELDGLSHDRVFVALHALRGDDETHPPLVHWELIPGHHRLPWGERSKTKMNRYWLTHELMGILFAEEDRRAEVAAAKRSPGPRPVPKPPPPDVPRSNPPSKPSADDVTFGGTWERPELSWAEPEIQELAKAFDGLALPARTSNGTRRPTGPRELQALRNRLSEGRSLDDLRAAVAGASETTWTRQDGSAWAVDPFAVVFKDAASVRRFAGRGRSVGETASSMNAEMRSSTRSLPDLDRDPPSKIATASKTPGPGGEARSGLAPAHVASQTPSAPVAVQPSSRNGPGRTPLSGPIRDERQRTKEEQKQGPAMLEGLAVRTPWLVPFQAELNRIFGRTVQPKCPRTVGAAGGVDEPQPTRSDNGKHTTRDSGAGFSNDPSSGDP